MVERAARGAEANGRTGLLAEAEPADGKPEDPAAVVQPRARGVAAADRTGLLAEAGPAVAVASAEEVGEVPAAVAAGVRVVETVG